MGIMINEDCNHFLYTRKNIKEQVDEAYLKGYIDRFAGTCVTDFVMNTSATLSFVPSETRQFAADKFLVKEELGKAVDYSETEHAVGYHLWYEKKLDMYRIWIDRCKELGIRPWLSFRMNDAELTNMPNHILSEYYYEHCFTYARVRHRTPQSEREMCRDYAIEDFRNYQLSHIEELLDRYDVYGIELDFQREIYCFAIGQEWDGGKIMADFMDEVRKITKKAETKWTHPIKISMRTHANPRDSLELGFDIAEMAKRGSLDLVIPSPNWLTTDNTMPLKLWRQLVEPYGVRVVGCIERHINSCEAYFSTILQDYQTQGLRKNSYETLCASAVNFLSQAPEDIYLFNYMDAPTCTDGNLLRGEFSEEEFHKVFCTVGDLEKLIPLPRRHVVTYNDTVLPWKKSSGILPQTFGENEELRYIKIETGIVPEGAKCKLRLGIKEGNPPKVFVNSTPCRFIETAKCEAPILTDSTLYCYEIESEAMKDQVQIAEIIGKQAQIDYADICINYEP